MAGPYDGAEVLVYVNMAEPTSASIDVGSGNAGVRYTADETGTPGNSVKVRHVAGTGNSAPLVVSVSGQDITVTLGTSNTGTANSTALAVRDAVNAHPRAKQLVDASLIGDGSSAAVAQALTALSGGAAGGAADFQPVARQQGIDLDDSMDSIDANSKGDRFSLQLPGRQSGSFELSGLQSFEDGTQARLRRAYQRREEVFVRIILPASVTGGSPQIEEAKCRLTGFGRSFPDSDVATFSAPITLQENWRTV